MKLSKRSRLLAGVITSGALLIGGMAFAAPANAAPVPSAITPGTSTTTVRSTYCVAQLLAINANADTSVCNATVTTTTGPVQVASSRTAAAAVSGQSAAVQAAAETGNIYYQDWSQTYYSGATWEIQKGRVYWDGTYAWDASHRGYAGNHTCHAPGSVSVGLAIFDVRNCNNPSASSSVTFTETFDWSFVAQGTGIQGVCEMLSKYTRTGVHTASLSGQC
jgi:hypothetical protein